MIIGIGGCSNSGKSRLAQLLCEQFTDKTCTVLCQDDYVLDEDQIPNYYEHADWEIPESIDIEKYLRDLEEQKSLNDVVICEGLFVFWFDELDKQIDRKIYLDLNKEEFMLRKAMDHRWGKEPEWYMRHIYDNHQVYGKIKHPSEEDIFINANTGVFDAESVYAKLNIQKLANQS
jgi:uridine kinase